MQEASAPTKGDDSIDIDMPPGFRFHPTDEEIITFYLSEKVLNSSFTSRAIGEVDLNKCEPWDLPKKAKMGEKEWYFFCQRDRKYPTGMRTNRATEAGYWKATGKDKEIYKGKGCLVGMKKTLVFYRGRAPKGEKTNWVMHEYRLEGKFSYRSLPKAAKDEWVVCRVFHKSIGIKRSPTTDLLRINSFGEDMLDSPSLPPLLDPLYFNMDRHRSCLMDDQDDFKGMITAPPEGTSDGNQIPYLSTGAMLHQQQQDHMSFLLSNNYHNMGHYDQNPSNTTLNSMFYSQTPIMDPLFSYHGSAQSAYLQQERNNSITRFPSSSFTVPDQAIIRALAANHETSGFKTQCKVEQFSSNQSMLSRSQDTGLSTEMNTEISSVMSKNEKESNKSYQDPEAPCSTGKEVDLACLWNY